MSSRLPENLNNFERELARLVPSSSGLSPERLLFEAGVASASSRRRPVPLPWGLAASFLLLAVLAGSGYLQERSANRVLKDVLAATDQRLHSLERKTEVISDAVAELAKPAPSAFLTLRSRYVGQGDLGPEPDRPEPASVQIKAEAAPPPSSSRRFPSLDL